MQDWEDLEFYTIDEAKQSRRLKIRVYVVLALTMIAFLGGAVAATMAYGWIGLFVWLFLSGIVLTMAILSNNIRYK